VKSPSGLRAAAKAVGHRAISTQALKGDIFRVLISENKNQVNVKKNAY
jgi:hypothetical protein